MKALQVMKEIHKKIKQGFKLPNISEFHLLVDLCASEDRSERLSACKGIFYLWDWNLIDNKTVLNVLSSVSGGARDVDGILSVIFCIVSHLCEKGDTNFLNNELPAFQRNLSIILTSNGSAVFLIVSLFERLEFEFVFKYFRPLVFDIMFGSFTNRSLIWSLISKSFSCDLYRTFVLWLKFGYLEDSFILFESLKIINISDTEKSLLLTIIIQNLLITGYNAFDAISMLKAHILNTNTQTQSLIVLALLQDLDEINEQYLCAVFDLFDWLLQNTVMWTEILWMMLTSLLPFTKKSVFYPLFQVKSLKLINDIKSKIETGNRIDIKLTKIKSVILKYTIYRHNSLHQSLFILRLLRKFQNDDSSLLNWLSNVNSPLLQPILQTVIEKYFITGSSSVKHLCLTIFEKLNTGKMPLYLFQLPREDDPKIIHRIVQLMCTHESNNNVFIQQILGSQPEICDNSFNVKMTVLIDACQKGYKLNNECHIYLHTKNKIIDVISQAELGKTLAYHMNTDYEDLVLFCNNYINSCKQTGGNHSTSSVIDIITIMCEKGVLDVSIIWDSLLKIVAGEEHPAIHKSVCNFLSKVPIFLKYHPDENQIMYKSARVLWHFANDSKMNQELALRSLQNYDLEIFDATFLSEECQKHYNKNLPESFITSIEGICWVHILKNYHFAELFIHFINKAKPKARFHGSYSKLFEAVINYLSSCKLEDEGKIKICLKVLTANWTHIPFEKDLNFLKCFISKSCSNVEIFELALYAILNLSAMNQSALWLFECYLNESTCTAKQKSIMSLLPNILLQKHRLVNEDILYHGLSFALNTDTVDLISGEPLNSRLKKNIISFARHFDTDVFHRRTIMKVLVTLWVEMPFNSKGFRQISSMIAVIYGYPFLKAMTSKTQGEMCHKYIFLSREIALHTRLMRCFDINVGLRHESFQDEVLENLLYVLQNVHQENREKNLKWILRVLCMCAMTTNDYLCKVVIYSINYLSGAKHFNLTDSLKDHLECFPLAACVISKITQQSQNVTIAMNEISSRTLKIHPVFVEVFKLSILRIRDDPSVNYETVIRRCL